MGPEIFYQLKEIESLSKMIDSLQVQINEESQRISKLNLIQEEKKLELQNMTTSLQQYKSLQEKLENSLKQRLESIAQEKIEKELWDLLLQMETTENEIKDIKTFQIGFSKTLGEIQNEVNEVNSKNKKELENLNLRIKLLQENLPSDIQATLSQIQKKNLKLGPFTSIQDAACRFCRSKLSKIEENEIDIELKIKTCKSCGRLFLPYNVVS